MTKAARQLLYATVFYLCTLRCKHKKTEAVAPLCTSLYDEHFPLAKLMDYKVFSLKQKEAIRNAMVALDIKLNLEQGSTKVDVEKSMKNHIITKVKLEGKYAP